MKWGICQRDNDPTKEQKTAEGHQYMGLKLSEKSSTRRRARGSWLETGYKCDEINLYMFCEITTLPYTSSHCRPKKHMWTSCSYWHIISRLELNWLQEYVFIIWKSDTIPPARGLVSCHHHYDEIRKST